MSALFSKTIMLTTHCSSGCTHCPFSNPLMEKLFLPPKILIRIIDQASEPLVVLSGGEPFEHPEISNILEKLSVITKPFRISTGGFIKLDPWIDRLQFLTSQQRAFQGISIGTDVLSDRVNHSKWVPIWENNIRLLLKFNISFSLTFTLTPEFNLNRFNFFSWCNLFQGLPDFLYLRYTHEVSINSWIERLKDTFGNVPIIMDDISSSS